MNDLKKTLKVVAMKSKHSNLVDKVFEEAKNKNKSVEYFDCLKPNGNISIAELFAAEFIALLLIATLGILMNFFM